MYESPKLATAFQKMTIEVENAKAAEEAHCQIEGATNSTTPSEVEGASDSNEG
jgi:hypothetical protein